jgi:signal transduction histidine kinase
MLRLMFLVITSLIIIFLVERLREEVRRSQQLLDELARSDQAKSEFVRHVSHELRTPMTTIRGNAVILRDHWQTVEPADRVEALADIAASVQRLEGITDNLLALARLDAGYTTEREPVIVVEIVRSVVARHERANPERTYDVIENASRRPVVCSPGYLEQVIENLLSNAEKYSPAHEPITVQVDRTPQVVTVAVLDRGKGFRTEEASAMFDAFYRADDVGGIAGLGIGLSICKRFAEAEGGFMSARQREGGGAEFSLTLPCASSELLHELGPLPTA